MEFLQNDGITINCLVGGVGLPLPAIVEEIAKAIIVRRAEKWQNKHWG